MKTKSIAALAAVLSFAPTLAHPHPGHGMDFSAGVAHPLQGWDHVLAMVAVGLWAAQLGGRARWAVPAAFLGVTMLGSALGIGGVVVPFVEPSIVASVMLFGLLTLTAARLPLAASMGVVGAFAIFHGLAHGAEIPANASGLQYAAGFALATAALHASGFMLATAVTRFAAVPWVRFAGAAIAIGGAILALN